MPILTPTANELNRLRWARNWKAIKQMKRDYFNLLLLCGAHEEIYRARPREKRRGAQVKARNTSTTTATPLAA